MADNPLSRGQIRPTRDPLDDVPNDVGGRDDNILPPTKKPPEMLELMPVIDPLARKQIRPPTRKPFLVPKSTPTEEELFQQRLTDVEQQEQVREDFAPFFSHKFNQLRESNPGEIRSLLMEQLMSAFDELPNAHPKQKDFSEENADVLKRILSDREREA
jgi:hypothetical protein|tara:strand:- start:61 stop:537 length:477 start_codon:yes stop_codon:yes gene_type:complete